MKKVLYKLKVWFPKCHIICAGDFNGTVQFQGLDIDVGNSLQINGKNAILNENPELKNTLERVHYNIFPNHNQGVTVHKRRTMMQVQRKKAEQLVETKKDYIISDL